MNRINTYYFINNLLNSDYVKRNRDSIIRTLKSSTINWPLFIATGSNHFVLQTLYCKLLENELIDYVPSDVTAHLCYIYDLNYRRNTAIIEQVKSINSLLNQHSIVPLYLKGVGNIIDGLYNDIAERIMFDIDLLIPDEQWETSAKILLDDGYQRNKKYDPDSRKKMKHYPLLSKLGTKASVEIHRLPVDYEYSSALSAEEVLLHKKPVKGIPNCYVMSDQHKIIQNFIHSQMHHNGHLFAKVYLRNIYDLFLLSKRESAEEVFSSMQKFNKQAFGYLRIMHKGFGISYPKKYKYSNRIYAIRHEINLRSRLISLGIYFADKIFHSYIKVPYQAITDKNLRLSLYRKLLDKNWYRFHLNSYKRIYRVNPDAQISTLKNSNVNIPSYETNIFQ